MELMLPKAIVELNICRDAEASGSLASNSTGLVWSLESLETTKGLGRLLARELPTGAILLLSGPLGAGKTSLVQGLAEGLGISEAITSPTFALAQHYPQGKPQLVHLDLYRLEQPASADELFLQEEEEARANGALMAVEWPERLELDLAEAWHLELRHQDEGRLAQLTHPKNSTT
jgi:tRNA threonylcarbamoyladenosine biosynthesis protein TsaE